jgi:hypothetical protein
MSEQVPFPDWLGYLGVVLAYASEAEANDHVISRAVAPQLTKMVRLGGSATALLESVEAGGVLTWHDLEVVEREYARRAG